MNEKQSTAYERYKQLVTAWSNVNPEMAEAGSQLIQWIEDKKTHSDVYTRQEIKATNWEAVLSDFPTKQLAEELVKLIKEEFKTTEISSDCPICPGCGQSMTISKIGTGIFEMWECTCECIIGSEIAVPYQATRKEVIDAQNEAILKHLNKSQK